WPFAWAFPCCCSCWCWWRISWAGSNRPACPCNAEPGAPAPKEKSASRRFFHGAIVPGRALHPVDEDVQAQPDHVHEVPVPSRAFEAEVALGGEVALVQTQRDEQQH